MFIPIIIPTSSPSINSVSCHHSNSNELNRLKYEVRKMNDLKEKELEERYIAELRAKCKRKYEDKVTIRQDLQNGENIYSIYCTKSMITFAGKEAKIEGINDLGRYILDIDNGRFEWTDEMFIDDIKDNAVNITINLLDYDEETRDKIMELILNKINK